jgi:hypothetical protein
MCHKRDVLPYSLSHEKEERTGRGSCSEYSVGGEHYGGSDRTGSQDVALVTKNVT